MPPPFLSYLRVYEPLRVFDGATGAPVREALARGPLTPESAGPRDRELCLRAQLRSRALPEGSVDVLSIPGPEGSPLVCPLDTRPRAGAALLAFLDGAAPVLPPAALPVSVRTARQLATAAVAELGDAAAHVVSASWTVPLPWFALVEQDGRQFGRDPRRVWWHVPMAVARARATAAEAVVRSGIGDAGPAEILAETAVWLERFDRDSVVELDYGGLVELFDDDTLLGDASAAEVHAALAALGEGDGEAAGACYGRLVDFWSVAAGRERAG
ncbi:hypothetical protein [Pseudonocardia sp. GCM10023141]|uniref:hypothetical protein n=1 Tax=Pseudonocardia sp. GCM10023141 TaxID=3252653 RepID=UPI00360FBBE5